MGWKVRKTRRSLTDLCWQDLYDVYDEYSNIKVHVGGHFEVTPYVQYVGGSVLTIDFVEITDFSLRDVDEFALRGGCPIGSTVFYAFKEPRWYLTSGLLPLISYKDLDNFVDLVEVNQFNDIYIDCNPKPEIVRLYAFGQPLRYLTLPEKDVYKYVESNILEVVDDVLLLSNEPYDVSVVDEVKGSGEENDEEAVFNKADTEFFRVIDEYDYELDQEIEERKKIEKKERDELLAEIMRENESIMGSGEMRENESLMRSGDMKQEPAKSSKKKLGPYARYGVEFKQKRADGYVESDSESYHSILSEDSDELKSIASSSDEEEKEIQSRHNLRYVHFNEKEMKDPQFFPGLVFSSKEQIKHVVAWYAVSHKKPLWISANDKKRYAVRCGYPCRFTVWISKDCQLGESDWSVKRVVRTHNGCPDMKIHLCNSTFLAKALEGKIRLLPDITLASIKVFVDEMFHIKIGNNCAKNTRDKALNKINGDHIEQYKMADTYCKELVRAHPGSSCYIDFDPPPHPLQDPVFKRLYVCLKPLVEGFNSGCRKVIGLDGCHTKGFYKSQILTAVALDPNNGWWPLAWAVVEKETAETWHWFLEGLMQDLNIRDQTEFVLMSDKQKGLAREIGEMFPDAAKRNCAQHIYCNFKKEHRGQIMRDKFWAIARSSNKQQLKKAMNHLKDINQPAYNWLIEHAGPKKQWVRAYFPLNVYSDTLCNNNSESFNSFILEARDKPLITMLEMIRTLIMERIRDRYLAMSKKPGPICVKIKKILDFRMAESVGFVATWNGKFGFQEKDGGEQYTVDVREECCSCGAWQLSGIPYKHAIPCLIHHKKSVIDSVKSCYKIETFLAVYSNVINPMNGMELWDTTNGMSLQPPPQIKLAGRPKKSRKRDITEVSKKGKKEILRRWVIGHCSFCKQSGHNIRKCPIKDNGEDKVNDGKTNCKKEPSGRGRGTASATRRGRGTASATGRGRGTTSATGRGRGTALANGRGRGTVSVEDMERLTVILAEEREGVIASEQIGETDTPDGRGKWNATPVERGRKSAAPKKRGRGTVSSPRGKQKAASRGRGRGTATSPAGHATSPAEESDSDVEIFKVVVDPDVNPSIAAREQRVAKRKLARMKQEYLSKKQKKP